MRFRRRHCIDVARWDTRCFECDRLVDARDGRRFCRGHNFSRLIGLVGLVVSLIGIIDFIDFIDFIGLVSCFD